MKLPRGPAIRALLWEDWRRSRVAFLLILLLGIGVSLTFLALAKLIDGHPISLDSEVYAVVFWPLLIFGMLLVFSLSDPRDITPRVPTRHYGLPLSPRKVALVHLGFRLVTMIVLTASLVGLVQLALWTFQPSDLAGAIFVAGAAYLIVQALAWTVGYLGSLPFIASIVVLPILLSTMNADLWLTEGLLRMESLGVPVPVTVGVLLVLVAWIAVEGVRIGRAASPTPLRFADEATPESPFYLSRRVWSPLSAQIAYEWQRKGRMLPLVTFIMVAAGSAILALFVGSEAANGRGRFLGLALMTFPVYLTPVAAVVAGVLGLLDDYKQRVSGVGAFLFSRAADSRLHARARLAMSVRAVAANTVLCLVLMGIGATITVLTNSHTLGEAFGWLGQTPFWMVCLYTAGYFLMVWTLYWMAIPAAIFWFWVILVTIGNGVLDSGSHPFIVMLIVWPPALALVVATGLVIRCSARNGLLPLGFVAAAGALVLAVWAIIAMTGSVASVLSTNISDFGLLTVATAVIALSLCPAFPILAQPMLVERLRRS